VFQFRGRALNALPAALRKIGQAWPERMNAPLKREREAYIKYNVCV